MQCVCHTHLLAVNDAVRCCEFLLSVLERINAIGTYVKSHTKVGARLVQLHCVDFTKDRIVTLDKEYEVAFEAKRSRKVHRALPIPGAGISGRRTESPRKKR